MERGRPSQRAHAEEEGRREERREGAAGGFRFSELSSSELLAAERREASVNGGATDL